MKQWQSRCAVFVALCGAMAAALGAQAWVSLAGPGGSVSEFRQIGGAALRSFATPKGASDLLLSADGSRLYVGTTSLAIADIRGGAPAEVALMDPRSGATLAQFPMPNSVFKMALDPSEGHLYATGNASGSGAVQLMSLDLHTGQTASAPVPGATLFSLYPLAVSRDGATVYVPVNNAIAIFDAGTLARRAASRCRPTASWRRRRSRPTATRCWPPGPGRST